MLKTRVTWTNLPVRAPLGGCCLLSALLAGVLFPGCTQQEPESEPREEPQRAPQQILHGVHLRQSGLQGLLWILDARTGVSYGPEEPTELDSLRIRFYDEKPDVQSVLTSRRGSVDDRTRTLVAEDSVVVVTAGGERLETERLVWDPKKRRIRSDVFFRLTKGRDVLTGIGIEADPDLTQYSVGRDVRAVVLDQSSEEMLEALDADTAGSPR